MNIQKHFLWHGTYLDSIRYKKILNNLFLIIYFYFLLSRFEIFSILTRKGVLILGFLFHI